MLNTKRSVEEPGALWSQTIAAVFAAAMDEVGRDARVVASGRVFSQALSLTAAAVVEAILTEPEWAVGLRMQALDDGDWGHEALVARLAQLLITAQPVRSRMA